MSVDSDLKRAVAREVTRAVRKLVTEEAIRSNTSLLNVVIQSVEVFPVTDLTCQVKIKTSNRGTHYFNVRVSGMT